MGLRFRRVHYLISRYMLVLARPNIHHFDKVVVSTETVDTRQKKCRLIISVEFSKSKFIIPLFSFSCSHSDLNYWPYSGQGVVGIEFGSQMTLKI